MKAYCPICLKKPSESGQIIKKGTYFRKDDCQRKTKFYCKSCQKYFSHATHSPCKGQKRRTLNHQIYKLLSSGVSLRRIAMLLHCDYKTVQRKMHFLAEQIKNKWLIEQPVSSVQFDDVETFEHSKCKPVSITLAVENRTRKIIGFAVSPIAAKGKLAKIARKKYGPRKSLRKAAREDLFRRLQNCVQPNAEIWSDKDPHYRQTVKKFFPQATHKTFKGQRGCVVGQGELKAGGFDPLFSLNHTAAMLRANMNRLFRRTWCTTKKLSGLEAHLWLYVEFHNTLLI